MGELTENIHTFVVPLGQTYSFAMKWTYDSWNRTQDITYPDGEVVTYDYDNAGQLQAMSSSKGNNNYAIIDSISYDKYGSRAKIRYGNGSRSTYAYGSQLHRLTQLKTYDGSNNPIQDIEYSYDNAGNIDEIENTADAVSGLGGVYDYTYDYDSLYRLVSSDGSFTDFGGTDYTYDLDMQFSASGNIQSKNLTATNLINGTSSSIMYNRNYNYNTSQPHTVHDIDGLLEMEWDANGNMIQFVDINNTLTRNLCWDEENRLAAVKDEQNLSGYIYNAGGERVWKITGDVNRMYINGSQYVDNVDLNHKTLYTSPYMVVADEEYTKHYYAGSQRVLTKIGGGLLNSLVDPMQYQVSTSSDYTAKADSLWDMMLRSFVCTGIEANNVIINPELFSIQDNLGLDEPENNQYFYHTDHLGSSSWITDASGNVNQHLQYLPFGESFIDQRTNHDIRFKFTTKEEDSETGYQYFGARYYASGLSVWLSVDPLASKFPNMSPYAYVYNNPVNFIDEWGLFGNKSEAKEYAKNQKIRIGWFSGNKIKKGPDGVWCIENKKAGIITHNDSEFGITIAVIIEGQRASKNTRSSGGSSSSGNFYYRAKSWFLNLFGIKVNGKGDGSDSVASEGTPKITIELTDITEFSKPDPYEIELDFLKNLTNQTEPFPRKNMKNTTVSNIRVKPWSIEVITNPSGGRDSNVIYLNNFDTCYKMNKKGVIYDTLVRTRSGGIYK